MDYKLKIGDENYNAAINQVEDSDTACKLIVDEREVDFDYQRAGHNCFMIRTSEDAGIVKTVSVKDGVWVWANGNAFFVEKYEKKRKGAGSSDSDSGGLVTPKMPSVVIRVTVEAGQQVKKGEELVVVSAMKMETPLKAPYDSIVKEIKVQAGDNVMPGDILVDLEAVELIEEEKTDE